MKKTVLVNYIFGESLGECEFTYDVQNLTLNARIAGEIFLEEAKTGNLFWSAFNRIRSRVDGEYKFLCNGARIRAYMSPLVRDANAGLLLYACDHLDKPDKTKLYFLFDAAPEADVGSLTEHQIWWKKIFPETTSIT